MHMSEVFMDTVAYLVYFLKTCGKKQPPFDQVRTRVIQLLNEADSAASEFSPDDYSQARFAIVAWIDEAIMNSAWNERFNWQRDLMQMRFYQTTNAGELFFERLNTLGMHQNEAREVYYLCLAMGFMGRYSKEEDRFLLDQLKTSNLKVLTGSSAGVPTLKKGELFPEAYPMGDLTPVAQTQKGWLNALNIALLAFPAALFAVLFLIYTFVLNNVSHTLINMMVP